MAVLPDGAEQGERGRGARSCPVPPPLGAQACTCCTARAGDRAAQGEGSGLSGDGWCCLRLCQSLAPCPPDLSTSHPHIPAGPGARGRAVATPTFTGLASQKTVVKQGWESWVAGDGGVKEGFILKPSFETGCPDPASLLPATLLMVS